MKHVTPSLAIIALTGFVATAASAASIADDLQLKVKGYVQVRATVGATADSATGDPADYYSNIVPGSATPPGVANGVPGSESEVVRFGIRRARLSFDAVNSTGWFANVTVRADAIETSGGNNNSFPVSVFQAFMGKRFKGETLEHELKFGLDKPYNNDSSIASNQLLLGVERPVSTLISFQREPGFEYKITAPFIRAGIDIQNGTNVNRAANPVAPATNGNEDARPSPFYSGRIEVSPGKEYFAAKKTESWAAAPGTQVMLGVDYQNTGKSYAVANQERLMSVYGPDLLIHHHGLNFLAEYRWSNLDSNTTGGAAPGERIDGRHWDAQIGYAMTLESGLVIEPALRYSIMNFDTSEDENSSWGLNPARDNTVGNMATAFTGANLSSANLASGVANLGSGAQVDLGLNLYWNGHANKTQIGYQRWSAEAGEADASAFYVQQQVLF